MEISKNKLLGKRITKFIFSFMWFALLYFWRSEDSIKDSKEASTRILAKWYLPQWKTDEKENVLAIFGSTGMMYYLGGICSILGYVFFTSILGLTDAFTSDGGYLLIATTIVVTLACLLISIASYHGIIYCIAYRAFTKAEKAKSDTTTPPSSAFPSLVGYVVWTIVTSSALLFIGSLL